MLHGRRYAMLKARRADPQNVALNLSGAEFIREPNFSIFGFHESEITLQSTTRPQILPEG